MTDLLVESLRTAKPLRFLLLLALVLPLVASAPIANAAARVQPILLQMAAQHPESRVGVIVQKQASNGNPESLVARLGGTVTKNLSIINAFAAQLPAKAVPELAKADGVRWVSLDAAVAQSTNTEVFTTWATDLGTVASGSIAYNFNSTAIQSGKYVWFNSYVKVTGIASGAPTTVNFDNSTVQFTASGSTYNLNVPAATLTFSPTATTATATFDTVNGVWNNTFPTSLANGYVFLTALMFRAPANLPGSINPVTWSGRFTTDTSGVSINTWRWGAAVYSSFNSDYNALGVKPCDSSNASQYHNSDYSATPENFRSYVIAGGTGLGQDNYTGNYSSNLAVTPTRGFNNQDAMVDSPNGANATYGYGSNVSTSFGGFPAEKNPSNVITRVEVALRAYVPAQISAPTAYFPRLTVSAGGVSGSNVLFNPQIFNPYVGAANAGTIYIDITSSRPWQWADFDNNLQLTLDQSRLGSGNYVYYDAVGLRVTSSTGTDTTGGTTPTSFPRGGIDTSRLVTSFNREIRATDVWNEGPSYLQGQGVGVAVVDSGIFKTKDLDKRVTASANFNTSYHTSMDAYGHGTFVAGIIGDDGKHSSGGYMGVAPKTNMINVRVSDDLGMSTESDVVGGLQWVLQNKTRYNIRVVNMSLNAGTPEPYNTSPLDAAAEVLWFNGIVVVVSAGNNGTNTLYAPANDPFVITVGASNDQGTINLSDDTVAPFSAYGVTETGAVKPDLVAPGTNIGSLLPQNNSLTISALHPSNRINSNYFRMSGTSMAAPMVAGAVALLLQDEPNLNPDQVKYRLKATANANWSGYDSTRAGAGYLDVYAAVHGTTTTAANTGTVASHMLWTGATPPAWNSVNWGSVNWGSVNWSSVNWGSVNWGSVNWSSDYWGQ